MRPRLLGSLLFGLLAVVFLAGRAHAENAKPSAPAGGAARHHAEKHADAAHTAKGADAAHAAKIAEHPERQEHHEHRLSEEARHKLMSKFDTNGDGKLDASELANAKKMIGEYRQRREQALAAGTEFARIEALEQLIQQLEGNTRGNGNGNGSSSPTLGSGAGTPQVTAAELEALHKAREERHALHELRAEEALQELHHAEGRLNHELERHHALLKKFDANHDGKLDAGERHAAKAAFQAHHHSGANGAADHHANAGETANHHLSHSHHGK